MITLKVGHRYRNRDGKIITITRRLKHESHEYLSGFRFGDDSGRVYKPNGRWGIDNDQYPHDLLEDLGLRLKLRKIYLTERKQKEVIIGAVPEDHPFYKDHFRFVSESGRYYREDGSRCRDRIDDIGNLVEEFQR